VTTPEEFRAPLDSPEGSRVDFQAAWGGFHFSTEEFLILDLVHRKQPAPDFLKPRLEPLLDQGIMERIGRGRRVRNLLPRRFYRFFGQPGAYTCRQGLDRETNKALLLKHIQDSGGAGATFGEFQEVLPSFSRHQVQTLLRELEHEGRVSVQGAPKRIALVCGGPKSVIRRNKTQIRRKSTARCPVDADLGSGTKNTIPRAKRSIPPQLCCSAMFYGACPCGVFAKGPPAACVETLGGLHADEAEYSQL
jgi:hypothetical protein